MKKVKLFQKDEETLLWSIDELKKIKNNDTFFFEKNNSVFVCEDIIFEKVIDDRIFSKNIIDIGFIEDGINVLVLDGRMWFENFIEIFGNDKYKFLFIQKSIENYWLIGVNEYKKFLNYIENSNNIKVISDISEIKLKNFYFEPKIHIQNYYNFNFAFPADLFLHGHDIFENYKNKKRIGIHFNKVINEERKKTINKIYEINHNELYFTVNRDCYDNQKLEIKTNYTSPIINPDHKLHGLPYEKYIDSFINFNIKSEMEFIYETHTINNIDKFLIKWTEKTIKHLFLGKPFIHMDMVAHSLLKKNGFDSYNSLFTKELWDYYENGVIKENTNLVEMIYQNILWLLNMEKEEWNSRIGDAQQVAIKNRDKVFDLLFNKSLMKYVKDYERL